MVFVERRAKVGDREKRRPNWYVRTLLVAQRGGEAGVPHGVTKPVLWPPSAHLPFWADIQFCGVMK